MISSSSRWQMDETDFSKLFPSTQNVSKASNDSRFLCTLHHCWQYSLYLAWKQVPIKLINRITNFCDRIGKSLAVDRFKHFLKRIIYTYCKLFITNTERTCPSSQTNSNSRSPQKPKMLVCNRTVESASLRNYNRESNQIFLY